MPAGGVAVRRPDFRGLKLALGRCVQVGGLSAPINRMARRHSIGFTLIELLVTLSISGILLAIAVPSYTNTITSNRLSTTANAYVASLNQARIEAVRRNTSTQFCGATANGSDTLGTRCASTAGAVYALDSGGATATKIQDTISLPPTMTLTSGIGIRYGGQGLATAIGSTSPYTGLVIDASTSSISTGNHRCVYITTGSIVSSCTSTGTCPNSEPTSCN